MLRQSLRSPDPTAFALQVSALVDAISSSLPASPGDSRPSLGELVDSFLGVDLAETTAALHVISAMVPDDLLSARIGRELPARRQPMPASVRTLRDLRVTDSVIMTHELRDGDDILLRLRWPDDQEATFLCYVDHNMGTIVKDAFVAEQAFDEVVDRLRDLATPHRDQTAFDPLSLADARAMLVEAIESGIQAYPTWTTDTWPACRPLLEMLLRGMPSGGTGFHDRKGVEGPWKDARDDDWDDDWDDDAAEALAHEFLASPEGMRLDHDDSADEDTDHTIAHYLADFIESDLHGVPRWSPVSVETVLTRYFTLAVAEPPDVLLRVPDVLRAFVRYAHRILDITSTSTTDTLAAVDRWEPEYVDLVNDPQMKAYRLALNEIVAADLGEPSDWFRWSLIQQVGGEDALEALDDVPLPDEEVDWPSIPDDIHDRVREVAELVDRFSDETFGVEFRTACRRLLGRVAAGDPSIFRRRSRADTAAAAVAWIVGRANRLVGYGGIMRSDHLHAQFGLRGTSSTRARPMLTAIGVASQQGYGEMWLHSADYLVSDCRRQLMWRRDNTR